MSVGSMARGSRLWVPALGVLSLGVLMGMLTDLASPGRAFAQAGAATATEAREPAAQGAPLAAQPAEVMVVLGETGETGIDPAIDELDALKRAPFDSFTKKTLLSKVALMLEPGKQAEVALPNGRKLRIQLLEKTAAGRFRVSLSINRPGKQDYLPLMTVAAAAGDPFFVAGQKHAGGTLIIGITVGPKS